jgi:hypothetical protein
MGLVKRERGTGNGERVVCEAPADVGLEHTTQARPEGDVSRSLFPVPRLRSKH